MFEPNAQDGVAGPGTVVGANVKLTGTISDVNDITVHGTVEGEVVSDKTVTIAETASVKGPVTAQLVSISGRVNGSVTAHQKLELLPTANISGGITTKELLIQSGAVFNGKCVMTTDEHGQLRKEKPKAEPTDDKKTTLEPAATPTENTVLPMPAPAIPPVATVPANPTFELED